MAQQPIVGQGLLVIEATQSSLLRRTKLGRTPLDKRHFNISVMRTNLKRYLSSVYFVNQPLHVSGIFGAHHQAVYCIYTIIGTYCAFQLTVCCPSWDGTRTRESTEKHNMYQLFYTYSIPPDDGLQICPKHVEVD
jgi:hypothetical protein